MEVAMAVLCFGAVAFLLCVLVALIREWLSLEVPTEKCYLAKFNPSRARREALVRNAGNMKGRFSTENHKGIAI
jgi:hypothetical protein